MAEALGTGVIELVADARKLRAGVEDAKKSLRTLGEGQKDISKGAARSIDQYIAKLNQQNATFGKSTRETELFRLAMKGASNEQIKAADAALRTADSNRKNAESMAKFKADAAGLARTVGIALAGGLVAAAAAFEVLVQKAASFQDLAEKVGDSAESIASLSVAAAIGGVSMEEVAASAVKLTKNLTGVDDESKAAGAAIKALGLNLEDFKRLSPVQQIEAIAKALDEFEDGPQKAAVSMALLGKAGADQLPFLKELANGVGRVNVLTQEQIERADAYADAHAKSAVTIQLHAARIATELLPTLDDMKGAVLDLTKDLFGLGSESDKLGKNNSIQEFARGVARAFAFVADAIDGVIRAFQIVGKAIAAFAVVMDSVMSFNFRGAGSAILQLGEDVDAILNRKFLGQKLSARFEQRDIEAATKAGFVGPPSPKGAGKKKLDFEGAQKADKSDKGLAEQQLALDLERIRRAGEEQVAAFSRSQDILEARRSANLVDDRAYYEAKLAFINLLTAAQEEALQQEIARLKKETFVGKDAAKDQLENDKKVEEAQAKISKLRADAVASREINAIQEAAANEKVRQSYLDAAAAADAFIASLKRQAEAEIAGVGRGKKFRDDLSARADIENRFIENRQKLEGELRRGDISRETFDTYLNTAKRTYQQEVEIYALRTRALLDSQSDWTTGAREALNNYIDDARNIAKQTEDLFGNALSAAEDALVSLSTTADLSFKSIGDAARKVADSIVADVSRLLVKQNITGPLAKAIEGGSLIGDIKRVLSGGVSPEQAPAPVETRAIGAAAGGIDLASSAAAASASISAASVEFSASVAAAGATFAPEVLAAGTSFASTVIAAGSAFAASVSSASVVSSGGGGGGEGAAGNAIASLILDSFASGVSYVPKTGFYQLHQGERVVPAAENTALGARGSQGVAIYQMFAPGTDRKTIAQAGVVTARSVQRELARGTA